MSVADSVVYRGTQTIIHSSMQKEMLKKIHSSHLGAQSCIQLCKDIMYWPGMQAAIKDTCSSCAKWAMFSRVNTCESMLTQPVPEYPWQFVSQDLCEFESR